MYISIDEAAKTAEVTTRQIRNLLRTGQLRGEKARNTGKSGPATWKVDKSSLEMYVKSRLK
ncbi:MAG: hypothetical protein IPL78_21230 [Chloroflexi bacterium]|nr:hypothetical protein [Chloroflexota bacterium]